MMENTVDNDQYKSCNSNSNEKKIKCLTTSEYNALINFIDSLINDETEFVVNKYDWLAKKCLSEYPHLHKNTVLSIIDARVQLYVCQCHHKVFNKKSSSNSSDTTMLNTTPNQGQQKHNKRSVNTMYDRYKQLVDDKSVTSPLLTLANNLRMPAMLVTKDVIADHIRVEKLKGKIYYPKSINNDDRLNTSFLDSTDDSLFNSILTQDSDYNSTAIQFNTSSSEVDTQLSEELNWLTKKLLSMKKDLPKEELNQSIYSPTTRNATYIKTDNKNLSPHNLATYSWLIRSDPQLAYEVYKCSVVDGYYGACSEFIKSCTGKRYEQILKQKITLITTDTKLQTTMDKNTFYMTEEECRVRGLDMTPDIILNEPIAISLCDTDNVNDNEDYTAITYVGGSDNTVKVINWIESKAMFGGPEQLRKVMQRQLFPYWNRYGPGAIIFWFGHIINDNEKDKSVHSGVSVTINKSTVDKSLLRIDSTESFNFWSKYCLLMDGFPGTNKIMMHNKKNINRQNNTKKKKSLTITDSV